MFGVSQKFFNFVKFYSRNLGKLLMSHTHVSGPSLSISLTAQALSLPSGQVDAPAQPQEAAASREPPDVPSCPLS